ncbi:MAG: hypothetical protein ABFC38_08325 [Methanospirillum sp.]
MKTEAGTARREPPDPSLPSRLREFHVRLPLAGGRPNALLPDDRILYLAAVLRDTPRAAPPLVLEAWREFLDLLRPHGVHALLAYRLGTWLEWCRPPAEVMDFLRRQHLLAAARSFGPGFGTGAGAFGRASERPVRARGPGRAEWFRNFLLSRPVFTVPSGNAIRAPG